MFTDSASCLDSAGAFIQTEVLPPSTAAAGPGQVGVGDASAGNADLPSYSGLEAATTGACVSERVE